VLVAAPPIQSFPSGSAGIWYFFSAPYNYSADTMTQLLGPLNTSTTSTPNGPRSHVYYWNPTLLEYVLDPTPQADYLHLGLGYWLFAFENVSITVKGTLPTGQNVPVQLLKGWNAIGVPNLNPIAVSSLVFTNPLGGTLTFDQAAGPVFNLISPTMFGWNGTSYIGVTSSTSGTTLASTMQPWQAYWIYANQPTTVLIPTGN
jgi:hypothetical protein